MQNNFSSLSDKFELIKPLGQGCESTVYLARHLNLDAEFAIKISPKNLATDVPILPEAKLLKQLNHPGIPKVYDFFEDDEYYYLVEEYVVGESFLELFLHQSEISPQSFFKFMLQLCEIFCYLHSFPSGPVYYQDLKPEHVILCADSLKLIDFSVCCNQGDSTILTNGNVDFSAPEVLENQQLNQQSDVYTLGKFALYLAKHTDSEFSSQIYPILQTAAHAKASLRYETVEEFRFALSQQQKQLSKRNSCKTITMLGSSHGCGTTHLGIALCCCINYQGKSCTYLEQNDSDALRNMVQSDFSMHIRDGKFFYRNFVGIPMYGPGILVEPMGSDVLIIDLGVATNQNLLNSSDQIILVANTSIWKRKDTQAMFESLRRYKDKLIIICTDGSRSTVRLLAKNLGHPVYSFRDTSDAFRVTKEKLTFFQKLLF